MACSEPIYKLACPGWSEFAWPKGVPQAAAVAVLSHISLP